MCERVDQSPARVVTVVLDVSHQILGVFCSHCAVDKSTRQFRPAVCGRKLIGKRLHDRGFQSPGQDTLDPTSKCSHIEAFHITATRADTATALGKVSNHANASRSAARQRIRDEPLMPTPAPTIPPVSA